MKKERFKRKIKHIIEKVLAVIIICISIYLILNYRTSIVVTGSMEPTIKVGSINIVKKTNLNDIKVDDIILYEYNNKIISHRVINKQENIVKTKGDNNISADSIDITEDMVKYKVVKTFNFTSTYISKYISSNGELDRLALICDSSVLLIIILIIIKILILIVKEIRKSIVHKIS